MDVRMPDGTIVKNVPEGTTKQQLLEKLGQVPQQAAPAAPEQQPTPALDDPGFFEAFGRAALTRMLGNAANSPAAAAKIMAEHGGIMGLTPDPRNSPLMKGVSGLVETATGFNPMSGLGPAPTMPDVRIAGEDVLAAGQTAAQLPGAVASGQPLNIADRFAQAQTEQQATSANFAEQAPAGTAVGGAAGDIATLLTGRMPARAAMRGADKVTATAEDVLGRAVQSTIKSVKRGTGRALETGAEGAFLAELQGADPQTAGAIAAGLQVATGPLRGVGNTVGRLIRNNKLGSAIVTATVVSVGVQQSLPGGDPGFFLKNFEGRSQEAVIAGLLGVGGAALGRVPKGFSSSPAVRELLNVTGRGAVLSTLNSVMRDPVNTAPVIRKFSEDPDYFGPKAKRVLTRALNSEKIDVRNTVDNLMKDRGFRKKFDALSGQ